MQGPPGCSLDTLQKFLVILPILSPAEDLACLVFQLGKDKIYGAIKKQASCTLLVKKKLSTQHNITFLLQEQSV